MTNTINSLDTGSAAVTAGKAVERVTQSNGASQQDAGVTSAQTQDVHITVMARNLVALEQQVRGLPPLNPSVVASTRQRISDGSYQVDPQRIAAKMLGLESDLSRVKGKT